MGWKMKYGICRGSIEKVAYNMQRDSMVKNDPDEWHEHHETDRADSRIEETHTYIFFFFSAGMAETHVPFLPSYSSVTTLLFFLFPLSSSSGHREQEIC